MEFRFWLSERLTKRGWTGAQFARAVGVTPAAVNKWLNKKSLPKREQVERIASALEIAEQDVWDALRETSYFQQGDQIMRILNLPPDIQPEDARFLHLAYRAYRQWVDEVVPDGQIAPGRKRA